MRLLTVLLLCFHWCLTAVLSVPAIDADCDDQNILEAVDEALKFHNNGKEDGNQFVLYRVTDAKIKNEEDGHVHYFVEYEIHEGSCGVKSEKTWRECQFQAQDPERGKCSAHLQVNEKKLPDVIFQRCNSSKVPLESPVPADHHQCLGCPYPVDTDSKEILHLVHTSIEKMNRQGNHSNYFDLERIVNATFQVVTGWNYNIHYVVRETNCSKSGFKNKNPDGCTLNKDGESGECRVQVSISTDGKVNDIRLNCISQTGMCLSCPIKVDSKDPELLSSLNQLIDEYNSNSNHTELYSLFEIREATKQAFHEQMYDVLFSIKPTNCSKPDHTILGDDCGIIPNKHLLSCEIKFNVTDKRINTHSDIECILISESSVRRASGLSPLRIVRTDSEREKIKFNSHIEKQKQFRGNRLKQNKKHDQESISKKDKHQKHEHDHDNSSSEEVAPHHTVPKCPGKLWQPVHLSPTVKTFTDDDLASATDNSMSLSEKGEESNSQTTKQILSFNDEDLLS